MSNNFDGPIILDSLADAAGAAGRGYFGTGGRTLEDSNGPRLAGGAIANIPGSATVPDGSLYMADIPALFMSLGANWVQVNSVSLDQEPEQLPLGRKLNRCLLLVLFRAM